MQIIQSGDYDIQKLMDDNNINIDGGENLTKSKLVSEVIKRLLSADNQNVHSIEDPFSNVSVSRSNSSIFVFGEINPKDDVLVIPAVVPLKKYETFVRSIYNIGKSSFTAIAYSTGSTVQILNDFMRNTSKTKCTAKINSISANTIEVAIDLRNSKINNLLDYIVKQLGYAAITTLFPNLQGINFKADFSVLKRSEFTKTRFGNLVS